jgi:SAM-dependent methyltransferase
LGLLATIANEEAERAFCKIKKSGFKPKLIVDFGCGTGDVFGVFESSFPDASIVGFDQSEKAIALARNKYPNAKLFSANMAENEMFSGLLNQLDRIDFAYFRNILLHLVTPSEALRSVKDHLSPKGILFAQEPDWETAEANWEDFSIFKDALIQMMQSLNINPYMGKQLKAIFETLGFQSIDSDVSTRKIASTDPAWEILYSLLEVGGDYLVPFLQARGVANVEEMRARMESARKISGSYYVTPAWVITWGNGS